MKKFAKIAMATSVTLLGFTASAGYRTDYLITIDRTGHAAYGAMGSVRADTTHPSGLIGCEVRGAVDPANHANDILSVICEADDGLGSLLCASLVDPSSPLVKVAQAMTSNSYVYFAWDPNQQDAPGVPKCTILEVATGSIFYPIVQ